MSKGETEVRVKEAAAKYKERNSRMRQKISKTERDRWSRRQD